MCNGVCNGHTSTHGQSSVALSRHAALPYLLLCIFVFLLLYVFTPVCILFFVFFSLFITRHQNRRTKSVRLLVRLSWVPEAKIDLLLFSFFSLLFVRIFCVNSLLKYLFIQFYKILFPFLPPPGGALLYGWSRK